MRGGCRGLCPIDASDNDAVIIENILLLDDISGMCTALLGTDIMRQTLRRWEQLGKPAENPLSPQKVTFKNALREVCAQFFLEKSSEGISSNRLIQSFSYTDLHMLNQDNPVREKAELAKSNLDFQKVIQAYTTLLEDMQQKFFATFKKDKRIVRIIKNLLENVSHHSSEPI